MLSRVHLTHAVHAAGLSLTEWLLPATALAVPLVAYLIGVRTFNRRRPRCWSGWRTAAFASGTAALTLAVSPAVATFAYDARGHMVQHLLIGMYAPLGLVLGAPVTLLLGCVPVGAARTISAALRSRPFHGVAHPFTAAALHVGGLYVLYLTTLYTVSTQVPAMHYAVHAHFLLAGYLFTWSIVGPDPAPRRPGIGVRVAALVVAAAGHAYLAKLLYAGASTLPAMSAHGVVEVQQAAQLMYYGGDIAEILLATTLFTWWYRRRVRATRWSSRPAHIGAGGCDPDASPRSSFPTVRHLTCFPQAGRSPTVDAMTVLREAGSGMHDTNLSG